MKRFIPLAAFAALFAAGCSSDYRVDFIPISDAPPSVLVDSDRIEIPAGLAIGVRAHALEDDERTGETLDMVPARPGIIGIERALEDDEWVIFGRAPGATSVDVYFADELVGEIAAVVTEQHEAPD